MCNTGSVPVKAALASALALLTTSIPAQVLAPRLLRDIHPTGSSNLSFITHSVVPGEVLMVLDDGVHGNELWRSDGTTAGTTLVVDFTPGPASTPWLMLSGGPREVWFVLDRGATKDLGTTDGTAAGTRIVLSGLPFAFMTTPVELSNGTLLFSADGATWRTDRTQSGTQPLGIPEAQVIQVPGWQTFLAPFAGGLWRTDGTVAGTVQVLASGRAIGTTANGAVLVSQPGVSQTTFLLLHPSGTTQVIVPEVAWATAWQSPLLMFGTRTLWSWDGVAQPQVLRTFQSIGTPNGMFMMFHRDRRQVLFAADDGTSGTEPWWTDGTSAGTRLLADITPGGGSTPMSPGFSAGDRLVFWAQTQAVGNEPWTTDGTAAGTMLLGDLEPGPGSSAPDVFGGFGGALGVRRVVLPIATSAAGMELWVSDGTPAGTRLLGDVRPGPMGSIVSSGYWVAVAAGNTLIYAADDGQSGVEPWAVDMLGISGWLGGGCDSAYISAEDPVLGAPWRLAVHGIPAGVNGVALISLPPRRATIVGSCTVLLDPATMAILAPIVRDPQGSWSTTIPLPATPALQGLDVILQPLFGPSAQPTGWSVGAAVWLTLGF